MFCSIYYKYAEVYTTGTHVLFAIYRCLHSDYFFKNMKEVFEDFMVYECSWLYCRLYWVVPFPGIFLNHGFIFQWCVEESDCVSAVSCSHFYVLSLGFMIPFCADMCRSGFSHIEINAAVFISMRLHSNKHTCDPLWAWTGETLVDLVLKLCVQINTLVLREVLLSQMFMTWKCVL